VAPERPEDRRPLCGQAGKVWWSALGMILEKNPDSDTSLERILAFCTKHRVVVLNAVQYPLDPKVAKKFPDADPVKNLGFSKVGGASSFKKMKNSREVLTAVQSLRERLGHPALSRLPVYCLGNDSFWFVSQALQDNPSRAPEKIPHPSAWWRRQNLYKKIALEKLGEIFSGI
jgi:hypothetical protein